MKGERFGARRCVGLRALVCKYERQESHTSGRGRSESGSAAAVEGQRLEIEEKQGFLSIFEYTRRE